MQHDINRETAKISALLSEKIDKYEYFTGEEILPCNQRQITKQTNFAYSPLGKLLRKKQKQLKNKEENKLKL